MSEIKMLNLFRCGSAEEVREEIRQEGTVKYFVTDYFDMIHVETLDQRTATLSECMGIKQGANHKKGVSHQRYCLYSSEEESDIFDDLKQYPVLMIIQLFINPDIYQAESFADGKQFTGRNWIARINDLIKEHFAALDVKWKTYQLLTAGDFAVIVRCEKIHTAYDICTLIRSVRFEVKDRGNEGAVFYSYSVCGVLDSSTCDDTALMQWQRYLESEDQVVVRIKYAQSFRRKLREDSDLKIRLLAEGSRLIGRYDHQISFHPEEFQQLYPYLKQYKLENRKICIENREQIQSPKVLALLEMMSEHHIAYMNERLLLNYDQDMLLENDKANVWILLCEKEWKSLYETNNLRICRIKGKIEIIETHIQKYYQSEHNLKEYFRLTGRLCRILYEINKLLELRISTANVLIQYETLIDSLDFYIKNISEAEEKEYADEVEKNLLYGIRALEIFITYIRNVNLQTFQAPNYDLQTNVCIEKVLLAYSQFLRPFMVRQTNIYELPVSLCPMIVPSMGMRDLSVIVPFHNNLFKDNDKVSKLMVVYSPTFSFLCETCFQIPTVFHEIAHQFRYENRRERNECLEKYILKSWLQLILSKILDGSEVQDLSTASFLDNTVDVIYNKVLVNLLEEEDRGSCLQLFSRTLAGELNAFCEYMSTTKRLLEEGDRSCLQEDVRNYLNKTKNCITVYDDQILKEIEKIDACIEQIGEREKVILGEEKVDKESAVTERIRLQKELKPHVRDLKVLQEQQICDKIVEILRKAGENKLAEEYEQLWQELRDQHENAKEVGKKAFEKWKKNSAEQNQIISLLRQYHRVNAAYEYFDTHVSENLSEDELRRQLKYQQISDKLCEVLLEELLDNLNKYTEEQKTILDWNTGLFFNEYFGYIKKKIRLNGKDGMCHMLSDISQKYIGKSIGDFVDQRINFYREVTSDLFMCAMMDLDGFGYLIVAAEILKFHRRNQKIQIQRVSLVLQCLYAVLLNDKELDSERFWAELENRMRKETLYLHKGLCEEAKMHKIAGNCLADWPENSEFKTMNEIRNFLEVCVHEEGLTSTQKWIIRVYRQVSAIIYNVTGYCVSRKMIGMNEIWKDMTQDKAYYNRKKELKNFLRENGGEELCRKITEILNSPAKFFVEKQSILHNEVEFILSQYERSCKNIF